MYVDDQRGAQYSKVDVGQKVLLQQDKVDSLHHLMLHHTVVSKTQNQVVAESPTGVCYCRNTTHVKKYETNATREGQVTIPGIEECEIDKNADT